MGFDSFILGLVLIVLGAVELAPALNADRERIQQIDWRYEYSVPLTTTEKRS